MFEELDHVRAVPREQADADATGRLQRMLIDDDGSVQRLDDPACAQSHFVVRLDVAENYDELISAHPDDVHRSRATAARRSGRDSPGSSCRVAGLVSSSVVDVLESVQIQEHHHAQHGVQRPSPRRWRPVENAQGQVVTVGQPGQLIVVRHAIQPILILDQLLLRLSAQRDIAFVRDVREDVAAVHAERVASHFDVDEAIRSCIAAGIFLIAICEFASRKRASTISGAGSTIGKNVPQGQCTACASASV